MVILKILDDITDEKRITVKTKDGKVYCAYENGKLAGYCVFQFEFAAVGIIELVTEPRDDALAQGLVRAVAGYAQSRMIKDVRFPDNGGAQINELAENLGVVKGETIEISEFFSRGGCVKSG